MMNSRELHKVAPERPPPMKNLCASLALLFPLLLAAPAAFAATVTSIEIEVRDSEKDEPETRYETVTTDGNKARLDFLGDSRERTDKTPYLLTVDGGVNWTLGNKRKKKFYCAKVEPLSFFRGFGGYVARLMKLVNPRVLDIAVAKTLVEPGPEILNYSTTRVQLVTTANVQTSVMLKKFEYDLKITDDVWYTTELSLQPFRKRWLAALSQSGYEKLDTTFAAWTEEISGPMLRMDTEIVLTDTRKKTSEVRTQKAEIRSIEELASGDLPEGLFTVPDCEDIDQAQLEHTVKAMFKEDMLAL